MLFSTVEADRDVLNDVSEYFAWNVLVKFPRIPYHFIGISCCEGAFLPYMLFDVWKTAC